VLRQQQAALAHAAQLRHHAVHEAHLRARPPRSARKTHRPPQLSLCTALSSRNTDIISVYHPLHHDHRYSDSTHGLRSARIPFQGRAVRALRQRTHPLPPALRERRSSGRREPPRATAARAHRDSLFHKVNAAQPAAVQHVLVRLEA
jgi:hypothetical protein